MHDCYLDYITKLKKQKTLVPACHSGPFVWQTVVKLISLFSNIHVRYYGNFFEFPCKDWAYNYEINDFIIIWGRVLTSMLYCFFAAVLKTTQCEDYLLNGFDHFIHPSKTWVCLFKFWA
jgi:hypothetical protein